MSTPEPAWDAALSFLDSDRTHAEQIAGHFDESARVFVYSQHRGETTFTNGVERYSQIFGRDSRLVIVLYRPTWGTTGFTKIEKQAIDSRRVDEPQSDFLIFVKMETCNRPAWLPASYIYGHWSELGPKGVADAIRKRLGELGKQLPAESPANRARQMREQREWEQKRREFLHSYNGRQSFDQQAAKVFDALKASSGGIDAKFESDGRCAYLVRERGIYASVCMTSQGSDRQLLAQVYRGEYWGLGVSPNWPVLKKVRLTFELEPSDRLGWREGDRFYTSAEAADVILGLVLDAADEDDRRDRQRLGRHS
jgi:hypothetical protein